MDSLKKKKLKEEERIKKKKLPCTMVYLVIPQCFITVTYFLTEGEIFVFERTPK